MITINRLLFKETSILPLVAFRIIFGSLMLIGSVIPFIRLKELTNLIHTGIEKLLSNPDKVKRNISKIIQMEKHQVNIQKQLNLIKQMKQALIFEVLK